ncbi:hypothetical protein [Legionella clemsonensis]|uniref:Uncharacterized protein n=1 Tax=Legionella clemsonensis TaxID=1867846 RepID=A0A222NZG1_9GAMM|nr:hypothetical protein [Legionella clemsonensis]ASQ44987.1 hypothetical protein clem_02120 [Legionella clemsonensis]
MSFYVNEKTKVILKFRAGKLYQNTLNTTGIKELERNVPGQTLSLTYTKDGKIIRLPEHQDPRPESAEKICWFGAFKYKYYGPFFQGKQRKIEKIVSDYHKICKRLERIKFEENAILDWFNEQLEQNEISETAASMSIDKIFAAFLLKNYSFKSDTIPALLQEFLECHTESDFTYFILNRQDKAIFEAAVNVSRQLNFNVEEVVNRELKEKNSNINPQEMSISELASYYERAVIHHIWQFHYASSCWHPAKGLEPLLEEFRRYENHFLAEIDYNLIKQFTTNPVLEFSSFDEEGYLVYDVVLAEKEDAGEDTHIIKVIGVDLDNGGYVYFLDPNDASSPGKPRIAHRISKDLFYHILLDIHGVSVAKSMSDTAFPVVLYRAKNDIDEDIIASPKRLPKRQHSPILESKNILHTQEADDTKPTNSPRLFRLRKHIKTDAELRCPQNSDEFGLKSQV